MADLLPALRRLAIPSVCSLISFLAYSSQYLFHQLDPLTTKETVWFNLLVGCIWICYGRACFTDAGRFPRKVVEEIDDSEDEEAEEERKRSRIGGGTWCRKCLAVKPARAHHCKICERCIPKMDHHCPWTSNCVSHTTVPHFIRFVCYATTSMILLECHLIKRFLPIYHDRNIASHLGPSAWQITHLLILLLINSITLFALSILLIHSIYSLATNTTMIESWEIERHESLIERAKKLGGFVYAPGGKKLRIVRQEFPYDIGIWKNICQGMGSRNPLSWLWPFARGLGVETGMEWETNGFEDDNVKWPPPDPDRMPRPDFRVENSQAFVHNDSQHGSPQDEIVAFRRRQQADLKRWEKPKERNPRYTDEIPSSDVEDGEESGSDYEEGMDGEIGWTNSDGDRLRDYGVDEEAEVLDDDIPLSELLKRRKAAQ